MVTFHTDVDNIDVGRVRRADDVALEVAPAHEGGRQRLAVHLLVLGPGDVEVVEPGLAVVDVGLDFSTYIVSSQESNAKPKNCDTVIIPCFFASRRRAARKFHWGFLAS